MPSERSDTDDADDWIDFEPVERSKEAAQKPAATVRLAQRGGKKSAGPSPVRASLWLRHELATWAKANGPRFRLQIGGSGANKLRLIPDNLRGKLEIGELRGAVRLGLGIVNLWPNEERPAVAAQPSFAGDALVLTLPGDFAKASPPATRSLPAPVMPSPPIAPKPSAPRLATPARAADELAAQSAALKAALGVTTDFPQDFAGIHLTRQEAAICEALLKRAQMTREGLLIVSHDPAKGEDERDEKTIDVFVSKLRAKLAPLGVLISGKGGAFSIELAHKARLRAALAQSAVAP